MKQPDVATELRPDLLGDYDLLSMGTLLLENLRFRVITDADNWLESGYQMLEEYFDKDVLDPYERYVEWVKLNKLGKHPFPFLMVAAYLREDNRAHLVGVISGNIMKIIEHAGPNPDKLSSAFMYAIGHQITSTSVRKRGIKGIGSALWKAAIDECGTWINEKGGVFAYSFLEAESDSIGFWSKCGYLWPKGVRYWQPPLEFDQDGQYICPEVPEVLMLKPVGSTPADVVNRTLLLNIVATVYLNWSLDKYRAVLASKAMSRAEDYVMGTLLKRVTEKMPNEESIRLIPIETKDVNGTARSHMRSIALSQGVQHSLEPLHAPTLAEVNDFDDMLKAMSDMAFGARTLGDAAEVLFAMASDAECKVVLTLSGAATIAKLDNIIAELIERDLVHCVVTTGAVICHGFNSERGSTHFKMRDGLSDQWLFEQGYNRVYDTIETEYALDELEDIVHDLLEDLPKDHILCSSDLVLQLGEYLEKRGRRTGFLQAAKAKSVPVFIPAFTDSEIGLDVALFNYYRRQSGKPEIRFDPFTDFERYCEFVRNSNTRGIITLGGGVPRNWTQQVGPYMDAIERREKGVSVKAVPFKYAVRICPDPPYWGGLSGSTYSEGVSWGKFLPPDEGGRFAEVLADFTLVFPILVKALFQRLQKH